MQVQSLGLEDPLEEEMATHSRILAWEIPWTEDPGGLQFMGFPRQDYWSGLPFPPPEDLPHPGTEPMSPASPALQAGSLSLSHVGSPCFLINKLGVRRAALLGSISSVQFISVAQLCPTLCNPMNCSTPGLPVHHQLPEFTQTHIHRVSDAISHLILCCPLLFLPPVPPSISLFQ